MRMRVLSGLAAVGAVLALPAGGAAQRPVIDPLPGQATRVHVAPRTIGPHTNVVVRFRQPITTEDTGTLRSTEALQLTGPSRARCIGSRRVVLAAATAGTMVIRRLRPRRLGGRWCTGLYEGFLTLEVQSTCANPGPVKAAAVGCPMVMVAPRTLATFHFRVTPR